MKDHLDWADAAKGLAILGIIAVHAGQRVAGLPPNIARLADAGRYGVQVFLLVSGLTIFLSIRQHEGKLGWGFWQGFYARRFVRIAPLAYAGLVANILVNRPIVTPSGLALTVLFVNGWSPSWNNVLILGGWVFSVVWMFYLSVPLLVRTVRTTGAAVVLVAVTSGAGIALTELLRVYVPGLDPAFLYMWPAAQLPVVALGVLLYFLTTDVETRRFRWVVLGLAAAGLAALAIVLMGWVPRSGGAQYVYSPILACGLLALSRRPVSLLVNPATQWLGRTSLSIFIWHFFVLDAIVAVIGRPLSGIEGFAILYGTGVIASVLVGWLSYATLEQIPARAAARPR